METSDPSSPGPSSKRQRVEQGAIVPLSSTDQPRTSSLSSSTLQLTGHSGSVYALEYSPNGANLCSASFDKTVLLWSHEQNYHNYNVLRGHKNAVLDCHWMDDDTIVSCGADKTLMLWDALTGQRLRKWQESSSSSESGILNACAVLSPFLAASVGDDGSCRIWDRRQKRSVTTLESDFPVLATAGTSEHVYCAGIDSKITCWDLKTTTRKIYAMTGHTDTVTCLTMNADQTHLLSNAMDSTCKIWDIRPYVSGKRQVKEFRGHKHSAEKGLLKCAWSPDGKMVTAGSADHMVHIWDEFSTQELYLLPGHKGCVNSVVFHPTENVICSGASDKHIFVGELS